MLSKGTIVIILLVLCLFVHMLAKAQEQSDTAVAIYNTECCINTNLSLRLKDYRKPLNYYRKGINDLGLVLSSPLRWHSDDYIRLGAILGGAATLYSLDESIYAMVNRNKTSSTEFMAQYFFEPIGNYTTVTMLFGMAGFGLLTHKERPTTSSLLAFESLVIAGLVTLIPKNLAGRVRPIHSHPINSKLWNGPLTDKSFWSGHTAAAFSVASVIAEMYDDKPYIQITAYGMATLAGISRIHDRKHWASDVFVGAVIGTAIGKLVVRSYRSKMISCVPVLSPSTKGVCIVCKLN